MRWPYGQCNDYTVPSVRTFNARSHVQCYRHCLTHHYIKEWNCVPLFIDHFITEYDLTIATNRCSTNRELMSEYRNSESIFVTKCHKLCPKECKEVQYFQSIKETENYFDVSPQWVNKEFYNKTYERRIYWDSSEPMFAYTDEPDLTFTEYLVYCGGLMGLSFGQSAKHLINTISDMTFWRLLWNCIKNIYLYLNNIIAKLLFNFYQLFKLLKQIFIFNFQNIINHFIHN